MVSQEEMKAQLKELMEMPENMKCLDCNDKRPMWASLIVPPKNAPFKEPLGCFCCYQCSGAHRRMGVHICFVRSTNLDEWKESEMKAMKEGGNKYLNSLFEAKLSAGQESRVKPNNKTEMEERCKYIFDKYQHRKWYDPLGSDASEKKRSAFVPPTPITETPVQVVAADAEADFFASRTGGGPPATPVAAAATNGNKNGLAEIHFDPNVPLVPQKQQNEIKMDNVMPEIKMDAFPGPSGGPPPFSSSKGTSKPPSFSNNKTKPPPFGNNAFPETKNNNTTDPFATTDAFGQPSFSQPQSSNNDGFGDSFAAGSDGFGSKPSSSNDGFDSFGGAFSNPDFGINDDPFVQSPGGATEDAPKPLKTASRSSHGSKSSRSSGGSDRKDRDKDRDRGDRDRDRDRDKSTRRSNSGDMSSKQSRDSQRQIKKSDSNDTEERSGRRRPVTRTGSMNSDEGKNVSSNGNRPPRRHPIERNGSGEGGNFGRSSRDDRSETTSGSRSSKPPRGGGTRERPGRTRSAGNVEEEARRGSSRHRSSSRKRRPVRRSTSDKTGDSSFHDSGSGSNFDDCDSFHSGASLQRGGGESSSNRRIPRGGQRRNRPARENSNPSLHDDDNEDYEELAFDESERSGRQSRSSCGDRRRSSRKISRSDSRTPSPDSCHESSSRKERHRRSPGPSKDGEKPISVRRVRDGEKRDSRPGRSRSSNNIIEASPRRRDPGARKIRTKSTIES